MPVSKRKAAAAPMTEMTWHEQRAIAEFGSDRTTRRELSQLSRRAKIKRQAGHSLACERGRH